VALRYKDGHYSTANLITFEARLLHFLAVLGAASPVLAILSTGAGSNRRKITGARSWLSGDRNRPLTWVVLRGFEPLNPSMRAPGTEVARGRWGRSMSYRSLSESLPAYSVAVLLRCTVPGLVVISHIPRETVGPGSR
jgi:hypothetical protein